jgi:molybdopterin-guanine dinucleotide biosynthesis protein A
MSRTVLGAIMAGGQSRRFGRNKALVEFGGRTVIERVVEALAPAVERIILVGNDPEPYRFLGLPIHFDMLPGAGALGGIYTAVVAGLGRPVVVASCDLPLVTAPLFERLAALSGSADAVVPRGATGLQPLCAAYGPACRAAIEERVQLGQLKVAGFFSAVQVRYLGAAELAELGDEAALFFNINTPEEYQRALALAGLQP